MPTRLLIIAALLLPSLDGAKARDQELRLCSRVAARSASLI